MAGPAGRRIISRGPDPRRRPPRYGAARSAVPWIWRIGTGTLARHRAATSTAAVPATWAKAAIRSGRSHANRPAMVAPFDMPSRRLASSPRHSAIADVTACSEDGGSADVAAPPHAVPCSLWTEEGLMAEPDAARAWGEPHNYGSRRCR
jgi:hypothetical protein